MVNGWGSRDKCKTVTRRMPQVPKQEDNSMALSTGQSDEEIMDAKPIPASSDSQQVSAPKRAIVRLDSSLFFQFFFSSSLIIECLVLHLGLYISVLHGNFEGLERLILPNRSRFCLCSRTD